MIRPGLLLSSIIFSMYLFDMSYDTDVDSSLVSSLAIMLTVIVVSFGICRAFQLKSHRIEAELEAKVESTDNDTFREEGSERFSHIDMNILNPLSFKRYSNRSSVAESSFSSAS
jgi:hypothetical protein